MCFITRKSLQRDTKGENGGEGKVFGRGSCMFWGRQEVGRGRRVKKVGRGRRRGRGREEVTRANSNIQKRKVTGRKMLVMHQKKRKIKYH